MPRYVPILLWSDLPTDMGVVVREGYAIDFKETVDPENRAEHAKDVAAFTNAYGGTIIVGAIERPDGVDYAGVPVDHGARVARGYELAVRDWLSPRPVVLVRELVCPTDSGRVVVAANVEPFLDQPVGACACGPDGRPLGPSGGWRFPIREGRDTIWLFAEQIAMRTNGATRRAALLLEAIPPKERGAVEMQCWFEPKPSITPNVVSMAFDGVDVTANVAQFVATDHGHDNRIRVPLDDVEAVWQIRAGQWRVRVAGQLQPSPSQLGGYQYLSIGSGVRVR
jgi:schlafen family protein